tara:strand:- start:1343 stop:1951 length:609 start_codon:yes stop_codon:yes gene_type:complete
MTKLLVQINDEGFKTKPTDIKFYGALRDKMIQKAWDHIDEEDFVRKVTYDGFAFYGCLFNGHDLLDTAEGRQRNCWRAQSIIGVDIDHCPVHPLDMSAYYAKQGFMPWLVYRTFSDGTEEGLHSYRLLWKVDIDHRRSYDDWASVIKDMANLTPYGDKHARDASRMWQGSDKGPTFYLPQEPLKWGGIVKMLKRAKTWVETK